MENLPVLRIDWATYETAKYAVEHWHYSHSMPAGKSVRVGAWEDDRFVGAIVFSMGANRNLHRPYADIGINRFDICELTRVALRDHINPVSRIVSIGIKMLRKKCPDLKLIISFADQRQEHLGIIYQAMNWVYTGIATGSPQWKVNGRWVHNRQLSSLMDRVNGGSIRGLNLPKRPGSKKYRYLYPLDRNIKKQVASLSKPYPKARGQGEIDSAPGPNLETEGASPI